jgi:hydrogenase expression/formation protein HypC
MKMCLAIPAKVVSIHGNIARVDFGEGVAREINVALVDVKVGEYVLVHAGYAIQVVDETEAKETIKLWNEIFQAEIETSDNS